MWIVTNTIRQNRELLIQTTAGKSVLKIRGFFIFPGGVRHGISNSPNIKQ